MPSASVCNRYRSVPQYTKSGVFSWAPPPRKNRRNSSPRLPNERARKNFDRNDRLLKQTDRAPRVTVNNVRARLGRHVTKPVSVDLAASVTVVVVHLHVKFGPAYSRESQLKRVKRR